MEVNPRVKDADLLINFFSDIRGQYESLGARKGLVSFCLDVLGLESFDIREVESACSDLRSIMLVISRELDEDKLVRFNTVVKQGIDKIDMWLHGVYNRKISENDAELLFGNSSAIEYEVSKASKKILRDDYFNLVTDYKDRISGMAGYAVLEEESKADNATDLIFVANGQLYVAENDMPWTDRNKVWIGNRRMLERIITSKYRKLKDKRLVEIIKKAYEVFGDLLLFKTVVIEKGSLDKDAKYEFKLNKSNPNEFLTVKRK